jgi:hypothetical protein
MSTVESPTAKVSMESRKRAFPSTVALEAACHHPEAVGPSPSKRTKYERACNLPASILNVSSSQTLTSFLVSGRVSICSHCTQIEESLTECARTDGKIHQADLMSIWYAAEEGPGLTEAAVGKFRSGINRRIISDAGTHVILGRYCLIHFSF